MVVTCVSEEQNNVGGPSSGKRRMLMSSVNSPMFDGVGVWGHDLTKKCYMKWLL